MWPGAFRGSSSSQQPCRAGEVFFTPFTGRLSHVTRVTQLEGAELGLEPNLFDSRTEILSVDQRDR